MYQYVEFYLRYWYKGKKTIPHIELGLWPQTSDSTRVNILSFSEVEELYPITYKPYVGFTVQYISLTTDKDGVSFKVVYYIRWTSILII